MYLADRLVTAVSSLGKQLRFLCGSRPLGGWLVDEEAGRKDDQVRMGNWAVGHE